MASLYHIFKIGKDILGFENPDGSLLTKRSDKKRNFHLVDHIGILKENKTKYRRKKRKDNIFQNIQMFVMYLTSYPWEQNKVYFWGIKNTHR